MWRIALAVALALVADARPAAACSCGFVPPLISPADGAISVPLNALVVVRYDIVDRFTVELHDATGANVPLTTEVRRPYGAYDGVTLWGAAAAGLAPNATYTIVARRDDSQIPVETTTTFTTGTSEDHAPPSFTGITSLTAETMDFPIPDPVDGSLCYSSCLSYASGHVSRMRFDYPDLPPDAVLATMLLRKAGDPQVVELPLSLQRPREFDLSSCDGARPQLDVGADYCARIIVYDAAGNRAGQDSEECTTTATCQPLGSGTGPHRDNCYPADECLPIVDPPRGNDGGCAASRPDGMIALIMTAMSWICARRGRTRRLRA